MLRKAASKVAWVGRTASTVFGLALVLALVVGAASAAFGANGDFFKVGKSNLASAVSVLDKSGAGPALRLLVDSGAPLAVNSSVKVANLNADEVDGRSFGCPNRTLFHEGACVEVTKRQENSHGFAHQDCTDEGRRLPSVEELLTFRNRSGHDFVGTDSEWTSEVEYNGTSIGANWVSPSGAVGWGSAGGSGIRDYRCVASPS
jgi:hypothetical protein